MESSFTTFWYFYNFFHLVCKLFTGLYQPLCWSVNCMSLVFELGNIFRRYSEVEALIYIRDLVVLLCMESSIRTVCAFSDVFLVCKLYQFGL